MCHCLICNRNLKQSSNRINRLKMKKYCHDCYRYFVKKKKVELNGNQLALGGSSFKDKISYKTGKKAELEFMKMMVYNNLEYRPSNKYENCRLHFDFIMKIPSQKHKFAKVEVKAMKARRRGLKPNPNLIYIELKNVDGNKGWIYGKSDYIAFEQKNTFLFVSTVELLNLVHAYESTMSTSTWSGETHTLYSRHNRDDLVMILHKNDLNNIDDKFYLFKAGMKPKKMVLST